MEISFICRRSRAHSFASGHCRMDRQLVVADSNDNARMRRDIGNCACRFGCDILLFSLSWLYPAPIRREIETPTRKHVKLPKSWTHGSCISRDAALGSNHHELWKNQNEPSFISLSSILSWTIAPHCFRALREKDSCRYDSALSPKR